MEKERIDITKSGKIRALVNVKTIRNMDVNYTIEGDSGETTTTSILINDGRNSGEFLMITFNYQDLKKIVEGEK